MSSVDARDQEIRQRCGDHLNIDNIQYHDIGDDLASEYGQKRIRSEAGSSHTFRGKEE